MLLRPCSLGCVGAQELVERVHVRGRRFQQVSVDEYLERLGHGPLGLADESRGGLQPDGRARPDSQ